MKIIKFRGKRLDNGEWCYGGYFQRPTNQATFILDDNGTMIEVDALSVGQFTGITDRKGVEIYVGDIVNCWGGEYAYGVWEFQDTVTILDYISDSFDLSHHEYHEVQGNIFNTNPQPTEPATP